MKSQVNFDSLGGGVTLNPTTAFISNNDTNMLGTDFPVTLTVGKTYCVVFVYDNSNQNTMTGGDIIYQEVGSSSNFGRTVRTHLIIFKATSTTARITGSVSMYSTFLTQLD